MPTDNRDIKPCPFCGGLVKNACGGRTEDPRQLKPREAWNLIETLKAIVAREPKHESTKPTKAHEPEAV